MPLIFTLGGPSRNLNSSRRGGQPPTLCGAFPLRPVRFTVPVLTVDGASAPLGSCVAQLFNTATDRFLEEITTDANGVGLTTAAGAGAPTYLVCYKPGSPDVAGTSVNTLLGVDG